jgi:hypothetical protein
VARLATNKRRLCPGGICDVGCVAPAKLFYAHTRQRRFRAGLHRRFLFIFAREFDQSRPRQIVGNVTSEPPNVARARTELLGVHSCAASLTRFF